MGESMPPGSEPPGFIGPSESSADPGAAPHIARVYDYYLGGSDHTAADRELATQIRQAVPEISDLAWANRGFVQRAATWMARQGVDQFIDIGAGLPTAKNTHSVVQQINPSCTVVYVDNDPEVVRFGTDLLNRVPGSGAAFLQADVREPETILNAPETTRLLDLSRPVGWLLIGVLYFVADRDDPQGAVSTLLQASAPGSLLALSHLTADRQPPATVDQGVQAYHRRGIEGHLRSRAEVESFFSGMDIVPPHPGAAPEVCYVGLWGAENLDLADDDASRWFYAAVARKPEA